MCYFSDMKRSFPTVVTSMLVVGVVSSAWVWCEEAADWKDYKNNTVGIELRVLKDWQEVTIDESPETGTVAFNINTAANVTVSISRQRFNHPFEVWLSSDVLTQLFAPGYTTRQTSLAGRSCTEVLGHDLKGLRQEAYYSSRPPFVDDITFVANDDQWDTYRDTIQELKKSLHWLR